MASEKPKPERVWWLRSKPKYVGMFGALAELLSAHFELAYREGYEAGRLAASQKGATDHGVD